MTRTLKKSVNNSHVIEELLDLWMKTNNQENAYGVEEQHASPTTYVQVSKKDVKQPLFINAATSLDTYGDIFEAHTNICSGKLKVVKRTMKF